MTDLILVPEYGGIRKAWREDGRKARQPGDEERRLIRRLAR
jgi:hypothetical protein